MRRIPLTSGRGQGAQNRAILVKMNITSSYKACLLDHKFELTQTCTIFRDAVEYVIPIFEKEWDAGLGDTYKDNIQQGKLAAEHLVHNTKSNKATYEFDSVFPNMPCYFLRAVIAQALGAVSSFRSLYKNWEEGGRQGNPPKLTSKRFVAPCFYRGNTSKCDDMLESRKKKNNTVQLKLYNGRTWNWYDLNCRQQDVNYLHKHWTGIKASAPVLIKKNKKFHLVFSFKETVYLEKNDRPLDQRKILAIDLGINTDATCSVMTSDGTILARKFIDFASDKDRIFTVLNRIRCKQSKNGSKSTRNEWNYVKRLNTELERKIASAIIAFAVEQDVNVIVFEFLHFGKKIKGNNKMRLNIWRKRGIQKTVEHQAHRNLIRVSRVCAWNTSRLAFDGSGQVTRNIKLPGQTKTNYSLCIFPSNKIYNCDLNASYNIGARYFLREALSNNPNLKLVLPSTPQRSYSHLYSLNLLGLVA